MTLITAHRGGAGLWPENSLTAFRNAVGLPGLDAIELDIQACSDGPLVVFHDPTLDRTTDAKGRLIDTPFAAVRQTRLAHTAGEPPPTLDEALEVLSGTALELKLEIKLAPGADAADMVRRCLEATDRHDWTGRTLFMSFDAPVIEALRRQAAPLQFSVLSEWMEAAGDMDRFLDAAIAAGATAIGVNNLPPEAPADQVALRAPVFERARAAGLRMGVWTVNPPDALAVWLHEGAVDDVTTDWPDRALRLRDVADES